MGDLPFFVQKVWRIEKGFFYQTRQNAVVGSFGSFHEFRMANVLNRVEFGSNVLDGRSPLQKLVGPHVHLKGWEASDLKVLRDEIVGFLVVLDSRKPDIAINELLIDDAVSHFHGKAIELASETLTLFAPFRVKLDNNWSFVFFQEPFQFVE